MDIASTSSVALLNDLNMYYEVHGQGVPLILIHGGLTTSSSWAAYLPELSKHFQVVTPDIRGHGKSKNPSDTISFRTLADDIAALVKYLELESPFVCGYSDGGNICVELGMNYPGLARAYVVGATYYEYSENLLNVLASFGIDEKGNVDFEGLMANAPDFAGYLQQIHEMDWRVLFQQLATMYTTPLNYSAEDFAKFVDPALLVVGDRDVMIPLEEVVSMYRSLPNAALTVVPNADHEFVETAPEKFTNIILDFFKSL